MGTDRPLEPRPSGTDLDDPGSLGETDAMHALHADLSPRHSRLARGQREMALAAEPPPFRVPLPHTGHGRTPVRSA